MMIAVVNQKGGVGKTTLAVHLAVWHHERGRRVAFIDADGQASSGRWVEKAEPQITLVRETNADALIEQWRILHATHELIIADGPANLAESTRALLLVADLALVPCGGTIPELESTSETIRMLRNARAIRTPRRPDARIVLNRLRDERFILTRDARQAANTLGFPVCDSVIRLREALADTPGQRSVAWRLGRRGRAAATEMQSLFEELSHEPDPEGID